MLETPVSKIKKTHLLLKGRAGNEEKNGARAGGGFRKHLQNEGYFRHPKKCRKTYGGRRKAISRAGRDLRGGKNKQNICLCSNNQCRKKYNRMRPGRSEGTL